MSKVIRLSDSDLETANECVEVLNKLSTLVNVCGFKPDIKFVISSSLNYFKNYIADKFEGIKHNELT